MFTTVAVQTFTRRYIYIQDCCWRLLQTTHILVHRRIQTDTLSVLSNWIHTLKKIALRLL